jgi:hypothetical protein
MMTHELKRRLRERGFSDEKIALLTPQQAHAILNGREGAAAGTAVPVEEPLARTPGHG